MEIIIGRDVVVVVVVIVLVCLAFLASLETVGNGGRLWPAAGQQPRFCGSIRNFYTTQSYGLRWVVY